MPAKAEILKQIREVLTIYGNARSTSQWEDLSDLPRGKGTAPLTLMNDTIKRFAPPNSAYNESRADILRQHGSENRSAIPHIAGVLEALRTAYDSDYLVTASELIHADLFSDFLEMAAYLLTEGYKDPAAVIVGSVLEEHLRQLCHKNGVPTDVAGKPRKADQMNADLAQVPVYSKLDHKSITAWLDLRNKADHGKYVEYTQQQIDLMLQGVRDFMARVPA